jgi:hypothetical protein
VFQHDASAVAVIKLYVHVLLVNVRVGRAGSGGNAWIEASVLLTPVSTQPRSRRALGHRFWLNFENLEEEKPALDKANGKRGVCVCCLRPALEFHRVA